MSFLRVNGNTIHCESEDAGHEQTFLFINSLGTDLRIWDTVVRDLRDHGNIFRFDKRGHGLSDVVAGTDCIEDFADDALFLIHRLELQKLVVVGLSVGGMIAQVLANRIPERITNLVLCDTRHKIGNATVWNERIKTVNDFGLEKIADGAMTRWFAESFRERFPEVVAGYRNMLVRTPAQGYISACMAIRDGDLTSLASSITVPTLCIVGAEDTSTPVEEVKSLSSLIKGSRFEVIGGSGHIPCVDNPKKMVALIKEFIA